MPVTIRHIDDLARGGALNAHPWDVVVVIDVIRAFTAAAWVLMQGASALFLAPDAETALAARADRYPDALLMKDGAPDPRFDLPNAPGRIAQEDLTGRIVIQTTGNGTAAAHAVRHVPTVLCAAFTTASASLEAMRLHATMAEVGGIDLQVPARSDQPRPVDLA